MKKNRLKLWLFCSESGSVFLYSLLLAAFTAALLGIYALALKLVPTSWVSQVTYYFDKSVSWFVGVLILVCFRIISLLKKQNCSDASDEEP